MNRSAAVLASLLPALALAEEAGRAAASKVGETSALQVLQAVGGLILVIAFILLLAWLVRRFANLPMAGKGAIRVLGGVALGSRERAVLVAVGGTRLLIGVAPGRVQTLHVLDAAAAEAVDQGFAGRLATASSERAR
jgi:flagellar protein FliO/FliZ